MPSATQCLRVAELAAIASKLQPNSHLACATYAFQVHKLGQSLCDLYNVEAPMSERRKRRQLQLETRVVAVTASILPMAKVSFHPTEEWPVHVSLDDTICIKLGGRS